MLPLCLGLDPGAHSALALVEPLVEPGPRGERARLVRLVTVSAPMSSAWAARAFDAADVIAVGARGRQVVGWAERLPPAGRNGWQGALRLAERRGQLLQALSGAGICIDPIAYALLSEWTSAIGLPSKKLGDGDHRVAEAERLVQMPADTLRGLGDCTIDAAEALLIATARAWLELGLVAARVPKPRKPKAPKKTKESR